MNINDTPSVTITDVARAAGVSVGTVSRVLNGFTNITQTNFDRVQQAIKELGYEKCRSAEQLVSRRNGSRVRTGNIGMVFTEMGSDWASHPMVAAYSMGVERACEEKGFHALIEFSDGRGGLPRCIRENKVDGLLVKTLLDSPLLSTGREGVTPARVPCALCGSDEGSLITLYKRGAGTGTPKIIDTGTAVHASCALEAQLYVELLDDSADAEGFRRSRGPVAVYAASGAPSVTYCVCGEPFDRFVVECESCKDWFHGSCLGLDDAALLGAKEFSCSYW